jgi:hypothetical protein
MGGDFDYFAGRRARYRPSAAPAGSTTALLCLFPDPDGSALPRLERLKRARRPAGLRAAQSFALAMG